VQGVCHRVLLVDDFAGFRDLIRSILRNSPDLLVVAEPSDGLEVARKAEELQPDLIVLANLTEGRPACDCVSGTTERDDYHMNDQPTVVIADDDAAILDVVRDLLSASFRIVAQVGDRLEAFRAINEHSPQLVVLDLSMERKKHNFCGVLGFTQPSRSLHTVDLWQRHRSNTRYQNRSGLK
jgi:chemotaxis response regulator CheB